MAADGRPARSLIQRTATTTATAARMNSRISSTCTWPFFRMPVESAPFGSGGCGQSAVVEQASAVVEQAWNAATVDLLTLAKLVQGDELPEVVSKATRPLGVTVDGVTEAHDRDGRRFGSERLRDLTERCLAAGMPPPETPRRLAPSVLEHQGGRPAD